MSRQLKEFVRRSGLEIKSPNSVSTTASNNNLIREIEAEMVFPPRLEKNIMSNENYGEFAEFVHMNNINNNNIMIPSPPRLAFAVSKLNPGMFNATVNKNFDAETRIDLKKILLKQPLPKTPIGDGLYIDTKEINGIYGRFMTGFSHTRDYGKKGDLNKEFFTVQIKVVVTNGTDSKGATVNFYKNGKIRFSGGFIGSNIANQPELIRRFMVNTYSEKEPFLYMPFEYNNLSGQFRVNGIFKNINDLVRKASAYNITYISYEPELSPFMYITYMGHKYILTKSGNIQISGASTPVDMLVSYTDGTQLAKMMYEKGDIILTGVPPKNLVKGKRSPKTKAVSITKQRAAVKVDGKQCLRMPKSELVDLAKKLGIVDITASTKKQEICDKIKKISNVKTATFRNTNKGKNVALSGSGASFKVGRSVCSGYSKTELMRVASILNITLDPKETKNTLCVKIEKVRNAMILPKAVVPPKPKKSQVAQQKRNMKKQKVLKKRGLNNESIKNDIIKLYGKRWMTKYKNVMPSFNNDIKEMKEKLNTLGKRNAIGVPFKKDADALKKKLVNRWKSERERNLEKKMIMNQLNVSGVPQNLIASYRNAATNFIMTEAPTMNQLQYHKKVWIKLRNNARVS